ncbi:hypothetical protein QYM36_008258, partial [Artemia franciscana]
MISYDLDIGCDGEKIKVPVKTGRPGGPGYQIFLEPFDLQIQIVVKLTHGQTNRANIIRLSPNGWNGSSDWRRITPAPEIPPQRVPTAPERPPQRVPENYQSDWYYELTDNMVNALRPGDLLQFRRRSWGARYCHWAIYIGPLKLNTKNEIFVVKNDEVPSQRQTADEGEPGSRITEEPSPK